MADNKEEIIKLPAPSFVPIPGSSTSMRSKPGNVVAINRARENLVTFEPVEPFYPAQSDVTLRYHLGTGVAANPLDWVGIFKSGCRDIDSPITCQWAPVLQSDGSMTRERRVVFPAKFLQPLTDQSDSYQFLYVSESSHILGASQPFKVMDDGCRQQLVGIQAHSPVAVSRDGYSTNQEATSYVNISNELVSSDDEWELATHEELCKTNSSTSDLSDIEILSTSPSKEAVKMQPSRAGDDDADDPCEFENIEATSLVIDDAIPYYCSNQRHVTAVSEALPTSQYPSMMGVRKPEPEIVEVKRKLKKRIKVGSEEEESIVDKNVIVKKSTKAKKLKQPSMVSRKTTKQQSKSKKMLNALVHENKLQIKNSIIVNSESSSDNEDYSSVLLNCNVRKRKRKNNTEKNKCHPAEHHNIPMSSESDLENHKVASKKKAKRRRTRTKMEEPVTPLCNRMYLRQQEIFDYKTAEVVDKLNRIIEGEQKVTHTKREKEYDNSQLTDQSMKMSCKRWRNCDEDKIQVVTPCSLEVIQSPDKSKVISRKIKTVDDSMKNQDTVGSVESYIAPHKVYSRKEIDENTKYEMISHSPHDMEYQKNTPLNSKTPKNSEENMKHQISPNGIENLISADRILKYSRNLDEIRNYTVIPLSNESMEYPENTARSKLVGNVEGHCINNVPPCKTQNLIFGDERNYKKMNNIDANKRPNITKGNLEMVECTQQSTTNIQALDSVDGRKRNDVSVCNLKAEKTLNNSKLTWGLDANCFQDDTLNNLQSVELSKKVKTNTKTPKKCDKKLNASVGLSEQKMKEGLDASKQRQVSQIEVPQIEEKDCRMLEIANVECKRGDGECRENKTNLSGGFLLGTSTNEIMSWVTPADCVKAVKKKSLRKNKSRTKKGTSMKQQIIKSGDAMDEMLSDRSKMEVIHQNASLNIPATKDIENVSANEAEKSGSSSHTREMSERGANMDGNEVVYAGYGAFCREKPACRITDGCMYLTDPGDLMAGSSHVDGALSSGNLIRKEKPSQSKIRASQSKFKAKYKFQGRSFSGTQYTKRRDISNWRKLCRILVVNKRRFKAAAASPNEHDGDDGDSGTLVELENTECGTESVVTEVTSRAGSRPQVPDLTQYLHISTNVALMDTENRLTYASVVKGAKQDPPLLHKERQESTVIEIPYEQSYAITQDSEKCLEKDKDRSIEPEDTSKPLYCDFVTNPEVSSMQNTHTLRGLTFENSPHPLTAGDACAWNFQPRLSGNLSIGRVPITQRGAEMATEHCGSNELVNTLIVAPNDVSNGKMAVKAKDNINAVAKRGVDEQVVEDNLGNAHESSQEDVAEEGDGLKWPLPTSVTRTSLLKEHPETGLRIPQKAERKASDHCIFTKLTQAVAAASSWLDDQLQTDHACLNIPVEASLSSGFELSTFQTGQTAVTEFDAATEGPKVGQPHQTSDTPVKDDATLTWPLPAIKSLSSKFGFGSVPEDQVEDLSLPRVHFPHRRPAIRNSFDFPWFPSPIQSQWDIPRMCGSSSSSEIKVAPGHGSKDYNSELVYTESKSDGESSDIRQRVSALEKLLEDLNSLLMQQREQLHSGGVGEDVTASGCSSSGKVKSTKNKRVSILKSKGGSSNLTKSSVETVSVKPKVRIYKTRIAELENQMNILRETLLNAGRQPVKIHVKCKKLHVKIRDGKRAAKAGKATDGPVTMTWTQEGEEAQVSPSNGENSGLDQEVNPKDIVVSVSHSEVGDAMCATPSQMVERYLDQKSTLRPTSECPIHTSASEVGGDELMQAATSRVHTDTSSMGCRSSVNDTLARVDYHGLRIGYRDVIPETLSNAEDYLQFIPSRMDESRVTHTSFSRVRDDDMFSDQAFSRLGTPDLIPKMTSVLENSGRPRKALSNLGNPDPIPETSSRAEICDKIKKFCSRFGESDQIRENYSRVGDRHLADSHSVSNYESETTRETVRTIATRSKLQADKLGEENRQVVSRQRPNIDAHHVSLVGTGDVPNLTSAAQDLAGYSHTHPTNYCSDCSFALHSCHGHVPPSRVHPCEPNNCSPASGVTPQRDQNMLMSTNMSYGNHLRPVASSFDYHPLTVSQTDSIPQSQYSHFTSTEKSSRHNNSSEICTTALQPMTSCLHHKAHAVCQNPQVSFSHDLHSYTPQCHEISKQALYQQPSPQANPNQHKLTMQNHDQDLSWDRVGEGSSPRATITEGAFPKTCGWHSSHNVANCIHDGNHMLQMMTKKNLISSDKYYLYENQPCLWYSPTENKHSSHISLFQPNVSRIDHKSREGCQERFCCQIPRLSSRVEVTDSAGVDSDGPASFVWSSPRKPMDATTHSGHFIPSNSLDEKTIWPASSKHEESHASITPCPTCGSKSENPHIYPCHQRVHDNNQYRNEKRICSEKQFQKAEHNVHSQNQRSKSPLCCQQQIPEDTHSACPFQGSHVLQSNHRFVSQIPCTDQHHYIEIQNTSPPCSSLSNPYQHYLQEDAQSDVCDHTCLNSVRRSSIAPTQVCENGWMQHHHHLQQADPTVDQLSPTADTVYQPNHRNACHCFCFTDGCMYRRQIEESQSCHHQRSS